jgi:cytochrome c biogenesis protein CcmG/thiol:disulfide interchange protein DsbE
VTRPRTRPPASILPLLFLAPLLWACSSGGTGAATGSGPPVTNAATAPLLPTSVTALPSMDPQGFDELLGQLEGTPVVVNYWASWCTPCRTETPLLVAAHRRYGDRVQFLGVDLQDNRDGAVRFIDDFDVTYPSVFDPSNAIGVANGLFAPPMTVFYDADGTKVATVPGQLSEDALSTNLEAIAG